MYYVICSHKNDLATYIEGWITKLRVYVCWWILMTKFDSLLRFCSRQAIIMTGFYFIVLEFSCFISNHDRYFSSHGYADYSCVHLKKFPKKSGFYFGFFSGFFFGFFSRFFYVVKMEKKSEKKIPGFFFRIFFRIFYPF